MEFSLNNKTFEYMGTVYRNSFTHEVTTESIISDSLPDVQRVIETEAMVCLRSKEIDNERVTIAGNAEISVIYADDEGDIRRIAISIPFSAAEESGDLKSNSKIIASVKAVSADTKMLNPRKLLVKCDILINVECYIQQELQMMLPADDMDESSSVHVLAEERDICVITDVSEKPFVLSDEYIIPPTKPLAGEILRMRLAVEPEEVKGVGNKAIIKGTSRVSILYRPEKGGEPVDVEFSTAFSQIMELGIQSDGMKLKAILVPTSVYFETDSMYSSDERRITAEIHLLAQCLAYSNKKATYIKDVYCSIYEISTDMAEMKIDSAGKPFESVEQLRGFVETAGQPESIVSISASAGTVYKNREGERLELKTTVCVNVMYTSEDGVLRSSSKKLGVSSVIPCEADAEYMAVANIQGEPVAVITAEGVEVKLNLQFRVESIKMLNMNVVTAVNIDTEKPKDISGLPSLVIKRFRKDESLWELAKKYCSVTDMILKANCIEGEPENDTVLIIPKAR